MFDDGMVRERAAGLEAAEVGEPAPAARIEDEVRRLEDDLARRSPAKDEDVP